MEILLAAVVTGVCLAVLGWLPNSPWAPERQQQIRRAVALLLTLLPLGFGALVLFTARERTRVLRFDYVGKRLAFSPTTPMTAGSSPSDSLEVEDLQAQLLGTQSVLLTPVQPGATNTGTTASSGAVLKLRSPSPAVRIDDKYCNSYPLEDGDSIVVARRGPPLRIHYEDNRLSWGSEQKDLPSAVVQLLSGSRRVYELAELDRLQLAGVHSFLHRPDLFGPWHLLVRSQEVRIERGGTAVSSFVEQWPVPAAFDLSLDVVYSGGSLRSQRRDRILVRNDEVEVRFLQPRRWARAVPPGSSELPLALGVPSSFAREEMIELPEPSSRFRGLTAHYRYDRPKDQATVTFLADEQEVRFGDLYALGTGKDRLLLLLDRRNFPRQILLDLALLSLFLAVFLLRGMASHAGLASVVGPVGLLLAHRLLFSHKAANQPPDFTLDAFEEARLALWLIPALLVFAWALAWLLRQPARPAASAQAPSSAGRLSALGWPLAGLVVAAAGAFIVSSGGTTGRSALALLPLLLGGILALAHLLARRPRIASGLKRIQQDGFPWRSGWIILVGVAVFLFRWVALALGMPETMRLPFSDFRLLWTVIQLPLCAAAVGLTLESLRRRETTQEAVSPEGSEPTGRWQRMIRHLPPWLAGLVAFYIFLVLAFLAVAIVVGDTGLLLVHVLAPVFSLLVLTAAPLITSRRPSSRLAVSALAALPLLAMMGVNAFPGALVRIVGWGPAAADHQEAPGAPVRERAAELSSTRAQQMFRLYMLANPDLLTEVGLDPAERVAIQFSTLQSYARQGGWMGRGYLGEELPRHLGITYLSDLVPMVFVLPEFGKLGLFGLALLYVISLMAVPLTARAQDDRDRLAQQGLFIGLAALLAFVLPSLYMLLANLNLVLFTGKNMNLLSLNSLSDVLESGTLLGLAVVGLGLRRSTA